MSESKIKRLIVSITAGAVLLLAILLCILIYQLISIKIERNKKRELEDQIAYYTSLTDEQTQTLEARQQRFWIIRRAYELGYKFDGDESLGD